MNGYNTSNQPLAAATTRAGVFALGFMCAAMMASAQSGSSIKAPIHMPQGAFLRAPSPDVAHLVAQVKSDHTVAVRYARLFHLPVKMVPLALAQLHLKKLTNDHIMQVHFVRQGDKAEQLIYKPRRVMAGTPVYCLPDGTPLLVRVCGNPIRNRVSPEYYTNVPTPKFDPSETLNPTNTGSETAAAPPNVDVAPPAAPLDPTPVVAAEGVLPPAELPIAPALPPAALKAASLPPVVAWAHGPSGLVGLTGVSAALAGLGALGAGSHSSPASSGLVSPTSPITPITPASPISPTSPTTPDGGSQPLPIPTLDSGTSGLGPAGGIITDVPEPGVIALGASLLLMGAGGLIRRRRAGR